MKMTNLYYNSYLSKCDLSNKYKSKDLYNIPNLRDIVLELPISQLMRLSNNSLILKNILVKSYFIFYILFYFKPYINYKAMTNNEKSYSLRFKISNSFQIQYFVHSMFIYFHSNAFLNFFLSFDNVGKKSIKQKENLSQDNYYKIITFNKYVSPDSFNLKKKLNIVLKIPTICFYKFNLYTNFFFNNINLKELSFFINFVVEITKSSFDLSKLKNFQCFWILDVNVKEKKYTGLK